MRSRLWVGLAGFAVLALVIAALPRFISDFVPYPANAVTTVSRSIYD